MVFLCGNNIVKLQYISSGDQPHVCRSFDIFIHNDFRVRILGKSSALKDDGEHSLTYLKVDIFGAETSVHSRV